MKTKIMDLIEGLAESSDFEEILRKVNAGQILIDHRFSYINEMNLFVAHFNSIPNFISEHLIDCVKANNWFIENYKTEIKDMYFKGRCFEMIKQSMFEDIFYFLYEDLLVYFEYSQNIVRFLFRQTAISKVEDVIKTLKKFKQRKKKRKPEINLLVTSNSGFGTKALSITKPKLSIEDNYNDDFYVVHKTIFSRLSKKNNKGLVLLHGEPGTGKTSYIRYLISSLKKDVFFLPPNMAQSITDSGLMSILIGNPNSIFIIEDAENIIIDRGTHRGSGVSALLNISDGLLSDCLNIQIICSFNTDISKVDSALMRKGRLIAKYEFKELETAKAQQLSNKLNFETKIYKPMTLTEIYNQQDMDFQERKQRQAIGFLANSN